jgi:nicotinamidase-related amidase
LVRRDDITEKAALLLLDFHGAVVAWHGEPGLRAVERASVALVHARDRNMAVYHVIPSYREDYPELPRGQPFDDVKAAGLFRETTVSRGIVGNLAPRPHEPIVSKSRYSPFFANDLQLMMRVRRIESLVVAGIATSGVVLSAVRDAWDLDYRITVLADASADSDSEVHQFLVSRIFPAQATVSTVASWIGLP